MKTDTLPMSRDGARRIDLSRPLVDRMADGTYWRMDEDAWLSVTVVDRAARGSMSALVYGERLRGDVAQALLESIDLTEGR